MLSMSSGMLPLLQANGLDEVDSILAFTKEFEPDVCMLVCESCSENTPVSRLRGESCSDNTPVSRLRGDRKSVV